MRVTLDYGIPVANGILTTYDDEQCKARTEMKGRDCARCAVEMANLCEQYPSDTDLMDFEEDE
jgi:6,7-dimethyl-8-ribityllumazine synthase